MLVSAVNSTKFRPFGINDQTNSDTEENYTEKCSVKTKKILRGIFLMISISFTWVGALYLMKISFANNTYKSNGFSLHLTSNVSTAAAAADIGGSDGGGSDKHETQTTYIIEEDIEIIFDGPLLATWYCSLWMIMFLPIYIISQLCCSCCHKENESIKKMFVESVQGFMEKGFTLMQFFGRCGSFCLLWILTNYMLIFSLRILDVTVVMALFSCSVSIVYLLSWVVLHQQFVGIRIVAVIICDIGIALLVYMDGVQHKTLAAVTIAIGSAIGAAIYKVFFKRIIGYTSFAQMSLFFSLIGLMNAILMWPLIMLLYLFGAETIVWSLIPWTTLTGSAVLLLLANIFGNFGIVWTYELFLNLGIFMAIPISSVIDILIYKSVFQDMKLSGILLIMFGFIVVLLPDNWNEYLGDLLRKRLAKWKRREQIKKNGRVQDTSTGQVSRLRTNSGRVK
ncbi:putative thiamine transporter SLC35F3 [Oppia nitens]|uniref:putative thiamine transporter SLC35F3 n=1 Tax=Oppia nitens TaxID=1686743 RepID=UPI0023D9B65C|nr:putative thiamine transporter SLC35F3 [Oppia nitens]